MFLISPETERRLTYRELAEQTGQIAPRLRQMGLLGGEKVAFLMDNGLFTAQLFLGVMAGGYVAVPLNTRAGVSSLVYTLEHSDARVVFVEAQYQDLCRQVLSGVKRTVDIVVSDIDGLATEELGGVAEGGGVEVVPGAEDVALLMYTSGSTGKPKAAVHTHRTVLAHGANSVLAHQLTAGDCSLLVLPLYHINAECVTLIPTLVSGGTVVIPHHFNVSHFWDWLETYGCTWSAVVPTIISQLLDWKDPRAGQRQAMFQRIRFLRSSSAPLSPALHREFLAKFDLWLIQAMGSSECGNIFSNPQRPGENKIGSPGLPWGFEVRIVNPEGVEVGTGEPGEVHLRGAALMQGYYKDPEGTATVVDEAGWFRTGDLAYRDPDGYLFVVGRSKELVIKGGVNIAPKQIDEVLESHPGVLEAAAVGIPDRYVGEDLVAYVVLRSGKSAEEQELLSFCESRLGHFKTPTHIYFTKDLPKGPSGKIQRLKLQERAIEEAKSVSSGKSGAENGKSEPAIDGAKPTPIEQTIAGIWMELLKQPHVGLQSNFFSLGGHSLLAIQSLSKLRERLPISLSLSDFFEHATVAQQAALIRKRLRPDAAPGFEATVDWEQDVLKQIGKPATEALIPRREQSKLCPLSPAQERLWFLEQFNPGVPVYNESEAVRLEGPLDVAALERALNVIVARHDILRTAIHVINEQPHAVPIEGWQLKLERISLRELTPERRRAELARLLIEEPRKPYRLETEPGIRAALVELGSDDYVFILMMHHIICDWSSEGVIWRELSLVYGALLKGGAPELPPLVIQHGDYAAWQKQQMASGVFEQDLGYWKKKLEGAQALLELPADRPRPPVNTYCGARKRYAMGSALVQLLRDCSREENISLFSLFTAALDVLLYRYSGSEDISLGIPLADRDRPELQNVIGFLLHTHVLRTQLTGEMSFRELLSRVQKGVLDLYTHRAPPFDQVVSVVRPERNLSYSPLFQVMINWRDRDQQLSFIGMEGLKVSSLLAETRTSKFDLTFMLTDDLDEIWLEVEYSTDLFDEDRIDRMVSHYQTLMEGIVANPQRSLVELPLLSDFERQRLLDDYNRTDAAYPIDRCLHELIEEQVKRSPDAVAIVCRNQTLSYAQLNERANQLAGYLKELGVKPDDLVAICLERSLDMVVGLLGILKAGGAYVPMDANYPKERLAFMAEDARPKVVLTQAKLAGLIQASGAKKVEMDSDWEVIARQPAANASHVSKAETLAYVIYTSGSTGKPKGVQIQHRSLINFLYSMRKAPGLGQNDKLLSITTLSFDIAGLELWLPLITGAQIILAPREVAVDGQALAELIERSGATVMQATPSTWQLLLSSGWQGRPGLKILCGGEPWSADLAQRLLDCGATLWNLYGPTETTVWSAAKQILPGQGVLLGQPIANTQLYVLDRNSQPAPIGIPGELHIGGDGLARGYLNRPELTAEKFILNPFRRETGARMYRTGDLARCLTDGNFEYLGRMDNQVKLRGFRIELGEIEAQLTRHASVLEAVVVTREETPGEKRLAAYVILKSGIALESSKLREHLQSLLPDFMVPQVYVALERFPLTPNGKIDRKAMPKPDFGLEAADRYAAPESPLEKQISDIWAAELGLEKVGVNSNFFELGGHSLLMVKAQAKLSAELKTAISIVELFQYPTVRALARHLLQPSAKTNHLQKAQERAAQRAKAVDRQRQKSKRNEYI